MLIGSTWNRRILGIHTMDVGIGLGGVIPPHLLLEDIEALVVHFHYHLRRPRPHRQDLVLPVIKVSVLLAVEGASIVRSHLGAGTLQWEMGIVYVNVLSLLSS